MEYRICASLCGIRTSTLATVLICAFLLGFVAADAGGASRRTVANAGTEGVIGPTWTPPTPDHVGGGALLTNKRTGYYMGRIFDGSRFDVIINSADKDFWGKSVNSATCAWAGPAGGVTLAAPFLQYQGSTTVSTTCPDPSAYVSQDSFGSTFNCVEGAALGPQKTTISAATTFRYNMVWSNTVPNRIDRIVSNEAPKSVPAGTVVGYRYSNNGWSVVYVPGLGWGFVPTSTVNIGTGRWTFTSNLNQEYDCGEFVGIDYPTVTNPFVSTPTVPIHFHWNNTSRSRSVRCGFDGSTPVSCTPGWSATLPDGFHMAEVSTYDAAGARTSIDQKGFILDSGQPVVTISAPSQGGTATAPATFAFSVSDRTQTTTSCSLDGGSAHACSSGARFNMNPGTHTMVISARDQAGNVGSSSVTFTALDSTPPASATPRIVDVTPTSAEIDWAHSGSDLAGVRVHVDGVVVQELDAAARATELTGLSCGNVYAVRLSTFDAVGNSAQGPSKLFMTDPCESGAPTVTMQFPTPGETVSADLLRPRFSGTGSPTATTCRLDDGPRYTCTSQQSVPGPISQGSHTFSVTASSAAGSGSAMVTFTVSK
jgi:hypothetical protein